MIRYSAEVVTVHSTADRVWVPQWISEKGVWDTKQLGNGVPSSSEVTAHTHAESSTYMTIVFSPYPSLLRARRLTVRHDTQYVLYYMNWQSQLSLMTLVCLLPVIWLRVVKLFYDFLYLQCYSSPF